MMRYNITPTGSSSANRQWKLEKNGRVESYHTQQSYAINAARRSAGSGDRITIHNRNGVIRDSTIVR